MNDEQYDMAGYLESAEDIARKKLAMYSELLNNISNFKSDFMQQRDAGAGEVNVPKEFIKLPQAKRNTSTKQWERAFGDFDIRNSHLHSFKTESKW